MKFKLLLLSFLLSATFGWGQVSITGLGVGNAYNQNFNTATPILPAGWAFSESGTGANATFVSGAGASATGNTYFFGVANEWNFGGLRSGSLIPTVGVAFTNNTGSTVTEMVIAYTGETWRVGTASRPDRLDFQYSTDATSLTTGTWTDFNALDYGNPGQIAGSGSMQHSSAISSTITGLSIANGATVWIRWNDLDATNSDDGMGIDDFSIYCNGSSCTANTPVGVISEVASACGSTNLNFSGVATLPEIYYWQNSSTGTLMTNDAAANLSVSTSGNYYVRTYNGTCWSASAVGPYVVTVVNPVSVVVQPADQSATVGNTVTFSVTASNATAYQWQVSTNGGTSWTNIGGDSNSYTTPAATLAMNGYQYQVIISGTVPCSAITSSSAVLTVSTGPCLGESFAVNALPAGWNQTSVTFASNRAEFSANNGQLTTIAVSNPQSLTFNLDRTASTVSKIMYVEVSTTSQVAGFTTVATYDHSNTIESGVTNCTVDLSGYTWSNTVYVRFRKSSSSSVARWGVDDIMVYCGAPGVVEIAVSGNGNVITDGDASPTLTDNTDFGNTLVGNIVSKIFTIENSGLDPLALTGANPYVTISGANAADFSVSVIPSTPIAASGTTAFEITFQPSALGIRTAALSIANNDADESPYNFSIQGTGVTCTPTTTISSITPASGPVGTLVTINGTGFTTASIVKFGALNAVFTVISNTVIQATVPSNATSSNITIVDAGTCEESFSSFTVITDDKTTCAPSAVGISELFISEVTDASSGSLSYIEVFNATATTIDMTDYAIEIVNNGTSSVVIPLTGTLASGDSFTLATSVGTGCAVPGGDASLADQTQVHSGINNNDCIHLSKLGVNIDTWGECDGTTWINALGLGSAGYDFRRKETATPLPTTTFNAADWNIVDFNACSDDYSAIDSYAGIRNPPLTTSPAVTLNCGLNSAEITVTGTEAVLGGASLTYQWFVAVPGNIGWTALTNAGIYSGVTTNVLSISNLSGLNGYQYYCQVMEDTATCYVASNATVLMLGGTSTTWNGTAWDNGAPTITTAAVINGTYVTATNGNFSCCSLTVNATRTLTISSNGYVEVQNNVNNSGSIVIQNDGQLIQINETDTNSGTYTGTAFQVNRTVDNLRSLDYVYWSAPVQNYDIAGINGSLRYYWNTTAANPNGTQGYWLAASGAMAKGQGYIVRGPSSFTTPQTLNVNFTGKPFNGQFTYPITRGTDVGSMNDNLILIGNPYPSAIDADLFLATNPNIEGAVHIWTHGTLPSTAITSPFYQNFSANYTMNDYIVYNGTATTIPQAFDGKIASGQGFFIKMNEAGAVNQTITFTNAMRGSSATAVLDNSQFFRDANGNEVTEKNRIWLDLINASNKISTTVVGYVSGATMEKDNRYDAYAKLNSGLSFYSKIGNEAIHIQGRALPFNAEDKVAMGMEIPTSGSHKIAIRHVDGLFSGNQTIYLEDKKLNIIHDLKANPYAFTVDNSGFENDRFVLRFTNSTLGNDDFDATANSVVIYTNESIQVSSSLERIKEVTVYDVLGRTIAMKKNVNGNTAELINVRPTQSALIVKVTLENNQVVTKKVIY
ncbi:Outer membrane autotransporter barrel [Flavobacterium saliperosum S13]|uniref:Lamin Tail Domain n=2 Tax=Flavobacterium saliperosum TaxID=329186 RepID=A0A1G4V9P6_9FLAO|nr:choice-of-anchor D domain-containing protein [Flavobacterium saliperosum]ESU28147.1 Outer membrane autotransporter barrel [Flavobacterium saliperosum S13]SCX03392.1 Lamin Tail Domain [Flavobacterium saliperosum]